MNILDRIDRYLNEAGQKVKVTCMECGKKFMSALRGEVKCPKCHSTDVEPD